MILLFTLSLCLSSCHGDDNKIAPDRFQAVVIYDSDAFQNKSIEGVANEKLNSDLTTSIFHGSRFYKGSILWKGNSLGVVTLDDGSKCKIAISYYGGYFKILGHGGYYKMSEAGTVKYRSTFTDILKRNFIPARGL